MSGSRATNTRQVRSKPRRESSPTTNKKSVETRKASQRDDKHRSSDLDLSSSASSKDEKEKDRRKKENPKIVKRARSPRRKDTLVKFSSKKDSSKQKNDVSSKDKLRSEKKTSEPSIERHRLFPDNSRLAQLIAQITNAKEERRLAAGQALLQFVYDGAHIEPLKRNCSNIFTALEEILQERGNNELKEIVVQCYASIGHVLGIDCGKFFQWIFSKIPSAANDQLRVLFLSTIRQAVKLDVGKQVFYDSMPLIMANLQDVLENAAVSELLVVILDILKIIAHDYPHVFQEYFRDAVDILVGWHIDTSQNDSLIDKTADCLVSFHPYWVSDMRFSLTLLGQFLEDMENYSEELSGVAQDKFMKEDTPSPYVSLSKLTALTRVFKTVVSGLGEYFCPGREPKITSAYITETVHHIITCVDIGSYDIKYEKLLISSNKCLTVLVKLLGHNMSACCVRVVAFVNSQLAAQFHLSYDLLVSALNLIEMLTSVGQALPMEVIGELLGKEKPLQALRCHSHPHLLKILLKIYQALLSIKNIPFLEAVYRLFVEEVQSSYKILLESISEENNVNEKGGMECLQQAHSIVVFDLSALSEIATFKSSVTGAWKVEPSTYTLLTTVLDPTDEQLAVHYPLIQFALVSCLFVHSQRCNHFIPSSKTRSQIHSQESVHLIKMLCKISLAQTTNAETKRLCALWMSDIVNSIAALPMDVQKRQWNVTQFVRALLTLSYNTEDSIREEVANSIIRVTRTGIVKARVLGNVLVECLPHLTNTSLNEKYLNMILAFPADILASLPTIVASAYTNRTTGVSITAFATCKRDLWLQCKQHMNRAPTGTLHSHAFKVLMAKILNVNSEHSSDDNIYQACQRLGKITPPVCGDVLKYQRFIANADAAFLTNTSMFGSVTWFWMIWEAANFCILSRLKTPLGKALDTFQAIEGSLKDLEAKFREKSNLETSRKSFKHGSEDVEKERYIHQATVLLMFLETLEKLMYNAFEGTASSLPPSIRSVRTFFRTNRSTCCEWLNRIQESVTILSCLSGNPEKAIRNGMLWLQHLENTGNTQGSDFEHAIVTVVDALLQLHCHESICGVLEWSRKSVGRHFYWLYPAVTKAKGSLESAAEQLRVSVSTYLSPDRLKEENLNEVKKNTVKVLTKDPMLNADPLSTQFLVSQTSDCYLQLCDWSEVQRWNQHISELRRKFPSTHGLHTTVDLSYVKAMMKFEDHDFAGVHEQLDMIPGTSTVSSMLQEQFPVLGKENTNNTFNKSIEPEEENVLAEGMTPRSMICQSRIYLMQALTLYWTSGLNTLKGSRVGSLHSSTWERVDKLLQQATSSASAPLQTCLVNNSLSSSAQCLVQLKSIAAIREALITTEADQDTNVTFMNAYGQTPYIDAQKTDISLLNESLRTASYLQFHHSLHKKAWVGPAVSSQDKLPNIQTIQTMTAKLARKQGNKKLAESLLAKQLSLLESKGAIDGKMYLTGGAQMKLKQLSASVSSGKVIDHLAAVDILKESAKLKRTLGNLSEAIDVLCSSILLSERQLLGSSNKSTNIHSKLSEVSARSFVTLAKWILTEPRLFSPVGEADETISIGPKIREVLKCALKTGGLKSVHSTSMLMSEGDVACGQLLHHSTLRCATLGKTWFAYADWCYKWGRKQVEKESTVGTIELIKEERDMAVKVMESEKLVEKVLPVLSKAHYAKDWVIEPNYAEEIDGQPSDEEKVRRQLMSCVEGITEVQLTGLLKVWHTVVDRVFTHYRHAASSYFTYLKLSSSESPLVADAHKHCEYGNITATLRLLRLLVKYSGELKQDLETPFEETPTKPWRGIIPQLFARLNHPEQSVQLTVASLLCRVAKESPQLVVYQTVVGCSDIMPQQQLSKSSAAGILRAYQYEGSDECEQPGEEEVEGIDAPSQGCQDDDDVDDEFITVEERVMQSSLHTILEALNEGETALVQEVKCVVAELRRITLLWDELWLGSLTQLHQEAQRRMTQLDAEIKRVDANHTLSLTQKQVLIKEKHAALMRPLIYALDRLQKLTSEQAETDHERNFQANYSALINKAIESVKNPLNAAKPEQSWANAKKLYQTLQARAQKRPMSNLYMSEVSPILARTNFTLMPIPGTDIDHKQELTLRGFYNDIQILPTKTKPKKLIMIGSDGQQYPYLFKGLEDLHLDERIMQFLQICNHMFARDDRCNERRYHARHYSVTPLGPRSGLIQWVDGATPLFALYRRWQQREAAAQVLVKLQNDKNTTIQAPMRPTELFYNKINPLLKEKGIDSNTPRKDWPIAVLRKAQQELSNDTPNELLSRELWCSSVNACDWWKMTQTYSRSVAVMSMIGYVIGLGDRHLDNILVDLTTGEVVHIDYNVCFEKGKALRVPEKVPFRMTRNMQMALGVTGVEGIFRSSCERVMQKLRQGREMLLTLLEAFVYDPLIDWTLANDGAFAGAFYGGGGGGGGGGEDNHPSRKEMERNIIQTLLSTRVAEMRVSWSANRDDLRNSLNRLKRLLETYCVTLNAQWSSHKDVTMLKHQLNILKAALVKPDHPLHTLQARYDKQAKLLSDLKFCKDKVSKKLNECNQLRDDFNHAFTSIGSIANLYNKVCKIAAFGPPSYQPAVQFLKGAGQSNIVAQCEQLEAEMNQCMNQRRLALRACLDTVLSYSTVVAQFSTSLIKKGNVSRWIHLLETVHTESCASQCQSVLKEHEEVLQQRRTMFKHIEPAVVSFESKVQQYFTEQNNKKLKLMERRIHEQVEALSGPVTETWNALRKFVGDAGTAGAFSLACVTVTALSTLNKRLLVMEKAAAVAGKRLMHLTSRDGDWFLDELCTMCANISQLLSVLKNNPLRPSSGKSLNESNENILCCMQVVANTVKTYSSLQELIANFRSIIVPEAVKSFLVDDPSVVEISDAIGEICSSVDLNELNETYEESFNNQQQLPQHITNTVNKLQSDLDQLTENVHQEDEENNGSNMTAGQMLLACFSGLFTKVEVELVALYESYRKMKIPTDFEELQQEHKNLKSSKQVCASANTKWLNFLFVKKVITIQTFFESCLNQSTATREINNGLQSLSGCTSPVQMLRVFNEELLCLPVKQFIAECVQVFVVGLASQAVTSLSLNYVTLVAPSLAKQKGSSMEELCKKTVEVNLKQNNFPPYHLSQASTLINAHDAAWRKHDLARKLDTAITAQKDVVQRAQQQLVRYQWLHEETLLSSGKKHYQPAPPSKLSVINEIKKRVQGIHQCELVIPSLSERYQQLQSSIEQRLKWASGANPALNAVLDAFADTVAKRKQLLLGEHKLAGEVTRLATSIVTVETSKTTSIHETDAFDQTVVTLVKKLEEACTLFESCMGDLGDVEQFMKSLDICIPPKEPITLGWMKSRLEKIEQQLKNRKEKEPSMKKAILQERETLKGEVSVVKASFTSHHALVGEVKSMLKTLAKDEEASECLNVRTFIQAHNKFSEDSSIVLKKILTLCSAGRVDISPEVAQQNEDDSRVTIQMIEDLVTNVIGLHDQLLFFGIDSLKPTEAFSAGAGVVKEMAESQGDGGGNGGTQEGVKHSMALAISPTSSVTGSFAVATPKRGGGAIRKPGRVLQEKNVYALNVWRRIKAKLEGRDLDPTRRVTVADQVSHVVGEAIDVDNLCQLYEGWTPWV